MKLWIISLVLLILQINFYSISSTTLVANNLYNTLKQKKVDNLQNKKEFSNESLTSNRNKDIIDFKDRLLQFISITSLVVASIQLLTLLFDEENIKNIKNCNLFKCQSFNNVSDSSIKTTLKESKLKIKKLWYGLNVDESLSKLLKNKYKALLFLLFFTSFIAFVLKIRNI